MGELPAEVWRSASECVPGREAAGHRPPQAADARAKRQEAAKRPRRGTEAPGGEARRTERQGCRDAEPQPAPTRPTEPPSGTRDVSGERTTATAATEAALGRRGGSREQRCTAASAAILIVFRRESSRERNTPGECRACVECVGVFRVGRVTCELASCRGCVVVRRA